MVYQYLFRGVGEVVEQVKDDPAKLGLAVAALASSLGLLVYSNYSSDSNSNDLAPALSEEKAKSIMNDIFGKVSLLSARLESALESIRQQMAAQRQTLDHSFMKSQILPHFIQGLEEVQSAVYLKHEVDEADVEDAVNTYIDEGDEELSEIATRIKRCYKAFGGEITIEEDDADEDSGDSDLSVDTLMEAIELLSEKLGAMADEGIEEFKENFGLPHDEESFSKFQEMIMKISQDAEKEVMTEMGISTKAFQNAVLKNQNSPRLQQAFMAMSLDSQERMKRHGIDIGM